MSPAALWRSIVLATCLSFALAVTALAQDAPAAVPAVPGAQVKITDAELLPRVITVTVGAQVTWLNTTGQAIRLADQTSAPAAGSLYLPLVKTGSGPAAVAFARVSHPDRAAWTSEPIAPSGQFSRTYTEPGMFPYYSSHLTATVGAVVVLSDTLVATVLVDAATGGVVEAGGSRLEIPPGALAQDTTIVLSQPLTGMLMAVDGLHAVKLEPAGLQLSRPATLTIAYGETGSFDEALVQVVAYGGANSEWEPQPILMQDKVAHTLVVQAARFAYWQTYIPDPLHILLEIPGQHLKPGYVLAGLTGDACGSAAGWFPGRMSIYAGATDATEYDPGRPQVVEALAGDTPQTGCSASGEVRLQEMFNFTNQPCRLYMGVWYPPSASEEQLAGAAAAARQQIGKGYLAVGQGNWQANCFSCTGLAAFSYRQAGANIIPAALENWPITPLQVVRRLRAVDEITIQPEESIRLRATTIYWVDDPSGGYYKVNWYGPQAGTLPSGSYYDAMSGDFSWAPSRADGGKDYPLQFTEQWMVAGEQRTITRTLTIHVGVLPNAAPSARDDVATATEALATTVNVLANDSDPDGDTLAVTAVSTPDHGSATVAGDGLSVLYTPSAGYLGSDSFTYTISDGSLTATASVLLTVAAADIDPDAMVLIPAGSFQMGCDPANPAENGCSDYMQNIIEQLHTVNLGAYYIDKYEVTNGRYKTCVDAGVCTITYTGSWSRPDYYNSPVYADYPVLYLTWEQAKTFCAWEGKRLPTEAEWEKAARGSSDTRKYPWGDDAPDCGKVNFASGSYPQDKCVGDTARVGSYPSGASPYGVMDLAGNVNEWVNDRFAADYYGRSPVNNPQGPDTGTQLVIRGGAWDYAGPRVAERYSGDIWSAGTAYLGFRCARSQ